MDLHDKVLNDEDLAVIEKEMQKIIENGGAKLEQKFDGIFMDTHYDANYEKFEDFSKIIANENCILSVFNYFSFRDKSELNYYDFTLNTEKFTIVVTPTHTINWTYFKNGNFVKGDNNIKFKPPTYLI
jgi:hypothetical protein